MDEFPKLVAMVGLARSGKSTFVRDFYIPHGYAAVSPDMVRRVVHGRSYLESSEYIVWGIVYAMADTLLAMGNRVVIDSTNITRHRRETWLKRGAVFHWVDTPFEICLQRGQSQANACDIVPTIRHMQIEFEPLGEDEPRWSPPSSLIPLMEETDAVLAPADQGVGDTPLPSGG